MEERFELRPVSDSLPLCHGHLTLRTDNPNQISGEASSLQNIRVQRWDYSKMTESHFLILFFSIWPLWILWCCLDSRSRGKLEETRGRFDKKDFDRNTWEHRVSSSRTMSCATLAVVLGLRRRITAYRRSEGASALTESKQTTFRLHGQPGRAALCSGSGSLARQSWISGRQKKPPKNNNTWFPLWCISKGSFRSSAGISSQINNPKEEAGTCTCGLRSQQCLWASATV